MVAYPLTYRANMRAQMGIYAQDQWTLSRLTVNAGLRFDYQNSYVPAQHLPAGPYIGERNFDEVTCVPCWKDWSPRGSVILDLFGTGKTAVKASLGRYMGEEILNTADANNPLAASNPSTNRGWTDRQRRLHPRLRPPRSGNQRRVPAVLEPELRQDHHHNALCRGHAARNHPASWAGSLVVSARSAIRHGTEPGLLPHELGELHGRPTT